MNLPSKTIHSDKDLPPNDLTRVNMNEQSSPVKSLMPTILTIKAWN